jgi:hypothetical protein
MNLRILQNELNDLERFASRQPRAETEVKNHEREGKMMICRVALRVYFIFDLFYQFSITLSLSHFLSDHYFSSASFPFLL